MIPTKSFVSYCPLCMKENIVATIDGPTCKHTPKHDMDWWPDNWKQLSEEERVKWLEKRQEFNPTD